MKRIEIIGSAALILVFASLCGLSQKHNSVTVDEFAHLPAGYYYWQTGDFSLYSKNPPLVKLIAALPLKFMKPAYEPELDKFPNSGWRPWLFANDFMFRNQARYLKIFEAGRAMTILLGAGLGLAVYLFARKLYGRVGAFLSLAVFCFSPDMIAHSQMATVDTGSSLFIFLAVMSLIAFLKKPSWARTLLAGLCLGLAQLAKFSSLSLLPFYLLAPALCIRPFQSDRAGLRVLAVRSGQAAAMVLVWLAMVAACYGFQGMFRKTADFKFTSRQMAAAQKIFRPLPAPFPQTYLQGLDGQLRDMQSGEFANYLMGKWYIGVSRKYFPIAVLVKVPVAILLLGVAALALGVWPGRRRLQFTPEEMVMLAVMCWLFALFSLGNSLQIGVRYLLPAFPLGFLIIGRSGKALAHSRMRFQLAAAALPLWLAIEALAVYPHYLSYFNQFGGGSANGWKVLLDSNYDWGQDLPALADYMKENRIDKIELDYFGHAAPEIYGINWQPLGEPPRLRYCAISAQLLSGGRNFFYPMLFARPMVTVDPGKVIPYQGRKALARAGYSIWIFEND